MIRLPDTRYEEIKQCVAYTIIDANITKYPFNVFDIAKSLEIEIISYQSQSLEKCKECFKHSDDGFSILVEFSSYNKWVIYYNEEMDEQRIRFTIMHEIGHIVLDHIEENLVTEMEANFFAKYILVPPCIVHILKLDDYIDIMENFNVSMQVAYYTINYYNNWLKYGSSDYTEYEKMIFNQLNIK